jgi:hypothetical protein
VREEKEEIDLHGIAIEERVSLMKHIENLYQHAVQTQSVSKREEITLKKRAQETLTECARNKIEVQILDEKILDLKNSRKITEENLKKSLNSQNIKDIQNKMLATVEYHETTLRDMEDDKKHLLLLMERAVESEGYLKEEIHGMREAILQHHREKIMVSYC